MLFSGQFFFGEEKKLERQDKKTTFKKKT